MNVEEMRSAMSVSLNLNGPHEITVFVMLRNVRFSGWRTTVNRIQP